MHMIVHVTTLYIHVRIHIHTDHVHVQSLNMIIQYIYYRKVSNIGTLKNNSSVGRRFLLERIILCSGQRAL